MLSLPGEPEEYVEMCMRMCICRTYPNLTTREKVEFIEEIITNLTVDPRKMSSTRRKYESAYDPRPSAQAVGGAGVAILALVLALLFLLDITALVRDIRQLWMNLLRKEY